MVLEQSGMKSESRSTQIGIKIGFRAGIKIGFRAGIMPGCHLSFSQAKKQSHTLGQTVYQWISMS